MRKAILAGVVLVLVCGVAFAQSSDYEEEGWKKRFASPTYGVSLATLTIDYLDNGEVQEDDILVPGIDIRIFNGINVAKRGGFYTGYEVGTIIYLLGESDSYDIGGTGYQIRDLVSGSIFIMSKYGYRIDLGTEAGGFSVGFGLGIGAKMGGGSVDVYNEDTEETESAGSEAFGPMLEAALEAAFRLGQNFRILGQLGGYVSPASLEWDSDATTVIGGEFAPVRPDLRFGFALNY